MNCLECVVIRVLFGEKITIKKKLSVNMVQFYVKQRFFWGDFIFKLLYKLTYEKQTTNLCYFDKKRTWVNMTAFWWYTNIRN